MTEIVINTHTKILYDRKTERHLKLNIHSNKSTKFQLGKKKLKRQFDCNNVNHREWVYR